jgi:hypothetical protein
MIDTRELKMESLRFSDLVYAALYLFIYTYIIDKNAYIVGW